MPDPATPSPPPDVEVSRRVSAAPQDVWVLVADPRRTPEHSPEAAAVRVHGGVTGPLPVGARFSGTNRNGRFQWSTSCVVVESEPGRAFAFDVSYLGLAVARWRYAVSAYDGASLVTEQWYDRRGWIMATFGSLGTGVKDRARHNRATMEATLASLASAFEPSTGKD